MQRVTGIGGIFFKAKDPKALAAWYQRHLGFDIQNWGGAVFQTQHAEIDLAMTNWCPFAADTDYFAPSQAPFMINYRVNDLAALLALLKTEGVTVDDKVESSEFGHFGWIFDPEGNKIELWQPPQ